ncbi:hypothetical protein [Clostridium botulinum]|uniref:hypothetical protein n=1 Tax=Clostridium botulinum TaxID=1491 RepID=UPI003DA62E9E
MDNKKSVAYLKMDMNSVKRLKTNDDYSNWANGCYKEANAFYNVALKCHDMLFSENMCAVFTNISFACELYFKCLLFYLKIDCRREHNLYKLYCKLPEEVKTELKAFHACGNTSKDMFERELEDLGQAFIIFRYHYERSRLACNSQFLLELLGVLHNITIPIMDK